jgi:hypothetical protein
VLVVGEQARFVQELRRLQASQPLAQRLVGLLGDRLQQRERHVLATPPQASSGGGVPFD